MAFIKGSLDDVKEPELVPEGEYEVTCIKCTADTTKNGDDMLRVMCRVEDVSNVMPVTYFLIGWSDNTPDDQIEMRKLEAKRFCEAFNVPEDFEPEDVPGQNAKVYITQTELDDGRMVNNIRLPRLES